jgi:hypothetical protein
MFLVPIATNLPLILMGVSLAKDTGQATLPPDQLALTYCLELTDGRLLATEEHHGHMCPHTQSLNFA